MTVEDWAMPERAAIAFRLDGDGIELSPGTLAHDESFVVMLNGEREPVVFTLPATLLGGRWRIVVDSREKARVGEVAQAGSTLELEAGGAVVWIEVSAPAGASQK